MNLNKEKQTVQDIIDLITISRNNYKQASKDTDGIESHYHFASKNALDDVITEIKKKYEL